MKLYKILALSLVIGISVSSFVTSAKTNSFVDNQPKIKNQNTPKFEKLVPLSAISNPFEEIKMQNVSHLYLKQTISGKLLFKHNIPVKTEPLYNLLEQKHLPKSAEPVQSARMRNVLANKEVATIISNLRSDFKKINDKYNQILLMSEKVPSDEALQEKTKRLYLCNEEAIKISNELDKLTSSEIDETSDKIKEILLTKLTEYQSQLAPIFIQVSLIDLNTNIYYGKQSITEERKQIVEAGLSLLGKIPYQWGGKATNGGWNERWNIDGNGMDCSGFIEWVYWTVKGCPNEDLRSTVVIASKQEQIDYEELQIGDLGMIYPTGTRYVDYSGELFFVEQEAKDSNKAAGVPEEEIEYLYNHVGIYVGKDMNGNDLWVHCKGEPIGTVTVGPYEEFTHYYKMPQ